MTAVMRIASGKILTVSTGQQPQLYLTTDAGKPSPGVGDTAICYDTAKTYECYVNGVWSLVLSPVIEGYVNHSGTLDNIMSQTLTGNGTGTTNSGLHRYDMSTGISVASRSIYIMAFGVNPLNDNFEFNCIIQNLVSGANGNRYYIIGIVNTPGVLEYGAYFNQSNSGSWVCTTTADGIITENTNIASPVAGDILTIKGMKNVMQYYVNGVIVATHQTITFTSMTCYGTTYIKTTDANTTTARQLSCDYIALRRLK